MTPTNRPIPWVWYAPTLPGLPGNEEQWMFERFNQAGIAIAGIDVGESYGSPDGRSLYSAFYEALTQQRGLAPKAVMLGRSRGGLMTLGWAVENADKVAGFAGIYPVCNLASYPGVTNACDAYHLTAEELSAHLPEHNPIDRLGLLARAGVPLFAIHGDIDQTVPLDANSGEMRKRYEALGGKMQLIIPPDQGHNMWPGFFQCQELVDFVLAQAKRPSLTLTSPKDYQVVQRKTQDKGHIIIEGVLAGAEVKATTLEARTVTNGKNGAWQKLAPSYRALTFQATMELPSGGWYRVEVRASTGDKVFAETAVEHVGVGEVFVVAGQSNSANHGEAKQATQTGKVAVFDDQRWQLSTDPQPGASGGGGSYLPPFGDAMTQRFKVPVGLIACGIGATSVREWLPKGGKFPNPPTLIGRVRRLPSGEWESQGEAFDTLVTRMKQLGAHGFRAVLWHQGESDANQADATRTLPGKLYRDYLEQVIRESRRDLGWEAPWFVAQVSYHVPGDEASPDIRAAQASLWKDGIAFEGPDTDALKSEWRDSGGKGVHFSGPGLREHAARWVEKVVPWLDRLLADPLPVPPVNLGVTLLVPGFTVRELPIKLSNLNNVEYAPDGRLFAAGYDGRFHLLRDTDGDGLEDKVDTFWSESSENYPLGMVVKDGEVYTVLTDEVVAYRDTNGDGTPDQRRTVVKGFDDPELVKAPYLMHRRVDSSMALTFGPDGALYVTMGNSAPGNAYWNDSAGVKHYSTNQRRGALLRFGPNGKVEQIATGLRYIMSLQWNRHGDLFGTDQEGATWVPNGNPFDELLHLQAGRHYGFPPAHPRWLTNVVDEPSVWDYTPQHESTCGFRFNRPTSGHARFGPEFWADDALVTGEARGKLYRTVLAKTAAGYVARTDLFARLGMLTVDCTLSPQGDLVVCCHSGDPDWGTGPTGEGRVFKISHTDKTAPQPVLTWPASATETVIAFDRPLAAATWAEVAAHSKLLAGRYVEAADRLETIRPGYEVVKMQQRERQATFAVNRARLGGDGRSIVFETAPRTQAVHYALAVAGGSHPMDVAHDLSGVAGTWQGPKGGQWSGWLPHPDFVAAREFTRSSAAHDALWQKLAARGTLTLRGQLDLWQMLIPATQPGSKLDYSPDPESVTVIFKSDAALTVACAGGKVDRIGKRETHLTVAGPRENQWLPLTLTLATPARTLAVSYATTRDPRPRALGPRRFLLPFARPAAHEDSARVIPEIAGGNWGAGRELFRGQATCVTCHKIRGEGVVVGPDLSNLIHRDYASVRKDIVEPSATINPDAIGYVVQLKEDEEISGTRVGETATELHLAQPGGRVVKLPKSSIVKTQPMKVSLMPTGLDKALTPDELRDLLTFLLTEPPPPNSK